MKTKFAFVFVVVALVLAACGPQATPEPAPEPEPTPMPKPTAVPTEEPEMAKSIVDIAAEDGRFSTLVAAVEAAGLAETLSAKVHSPSLLPLMTLLLRCPKAPWKHCWLISMR